MRFVKAALVAAGASVSILAAAAPQVSEASTMTSASTVPSGRVIPNPSAPGTPTKFDVFCGGEAKSATLLGGSLGLAELILMHSTPSTVPGEFVVTVTLPANIAPGRYHPSFDCSNGALGSVSLSVSPVPHQAPETGDGATATETGTPLASIGYGLIGLGALTGLGALAMRRRVAPRS